MKKLLLIIMSVLFLSIYIYSQPILNGSTTLSGGGVSISQVNGSTYSLGSYAIGKEIINGNTNIYRTYYELSLSAIPTTATISSVAVYYSCGTGSYTFKLTQLSTVSSSYSENWAAIGNGSSLHTGLQYNGSYFTSTSIKTAIQNALSSRKIIIGALSESESTDGSRSSLSISFVVSYTYPATSLTLQARNDLEGSNGGNIGAGIYPASAVTSASPFSINAYESQKLNLAAYDNQTVNSEVWVFNDSEAPSNKSDWKKDHFNTKTLLGNSSSITTPQLSSDDNGASFVAFLKKICNATFQNNFSGGIITAGGISGNSPQVRQVVKQNTITVTAQQLYENYNNSGLDYSFSNWDGGSTSLSKSFTIYNHEQHTANYIRRANTSQVFEWDFTNVAVGNNIRLTWNEHPNTNVTQYKIWRRDKNGTESYIGTVNRGTTSFTDYDYQYASENDPDKGTLFYNVSVYCSLDGGSWSSDGMKLVTGVEGLMKENLATNTNNLLPTEYKIDNYPNPFNPATTIKYQLPQAGIVTIKVYDILGKEAATLVNEIKPAGYYSVNFDGRELTSGIYIATIQANNFIQSKKMLLVK